MGNFYVDIVHDATGEVLEHMGPMSEHEAQQVRRGASINLNHEEYSVHIVEDNDSDSPRES